VFSVSEWAAPVITRRQFITVLAGTAAVGLGTGTYAFAVEPGFRLVVTEWTLQTARWPYAQPLRIVILSDIHAVEPWMPASRIQAIVGKANTLGGDIILLLGDYVSGIGERLRMGRVPAAEWGPPLAALRAPLGVHAIVGNHDWWSDLEAVKGALRDAAIPLYQNRAIRIAGTTPFWLAGTDSLVAHPLGGGRFRGEDDLPGTLAQITDDAPAILMAHEPDLFVDVPDRFAVTLSGHTHGGQVRLPFLGRPVVPSSFGQRFAYGHVREDGRDLIVSGGLGCSIAPVRFGVPPEITVVTLRSPASAPGQAATG
jgi:predicted MPP superfamily phosphohydrolase